MSKYILSTLLCLLCVSFASAQSTGNEWINYSQEYFKLKITEKGIYRLDYEQLAAAGFPVETVDPKRIQLFHRGVEQAVYVQGEADAHFDEQDYIEFYGRGNDGTLDAELYEGQQVLNPYYNLFSDTTVFYLSWAKDGSRGRRMSSNNSENNVTALPVESYHWAEDLQVFSAHYSRGQHFPKGRAGSETILSQYDEGEGWTSGFARRNQTITFQALNLQYIDRNVNPILELRLAGRNNRKHRVRIAVGPTPTNLRTLEEVRFDYYSPYLFQDTLTVADISASGEIYIGVTPLGVNSQQDVVALSSLRFLYPQTFTVESGRTMKYFQLKENTNDKAYVEVTNVPAGGRFWDVTDAHNPIRITNPVQQGRLEAVISNAASSRKLLMSSTTKSVMNVEEVNFRKLNPTQYNYLIVSHPNLRRPAGEVSDPVQAYADFRRSAQGGGYSPLVINMEELYDQFTYGERTPLALRRFARYMLQNGDPAFLFLIGKGVAYEDDGVNGGGQGQNTYLRKEGRVREYQNLVPSYGDPGSDVAITAALEGSGYAPAIPTGRLSALNPQHVVNYLEKVRTMVQTPFDQLWRKKLLHLSGGQSPYEVDLFRSYMAGFENTAEKPYLGGEVTTFQKKTTKAVELINVAEEVNNGVAMITFFGHAAPNIVDIEIGLVSDPLMGYDNGGRYPFVMVNGCNAGDVFTTNYNFPDDWMMTQGLGSVGFLAHTNVGFSTLLRTYTSLFYQTAFSDSVYVYRSLGEIQQETIRRYQAQKGNFMNERDITQMQQMVLQGDPAVKLFGADKPDFAANSEGVLVSAFDAEGRVTAESDSFALGIITKNFGLAIPGQLSIGVSRTFADGTSITYDPFQFETLNYQDTLWLSIPNADVFDNAGLNAFEIQLDATQDFDELDETNNLIRFDYYLPRSGVENLLPQTHALVDTTKIKLWVQSSDRLAVNQQYEIQLDTTPAFDSPFRRDTLITANSLTHWPVTLPAEDSVVYYWRSRLTGNDSWFVNDFQYVAGASEGWSQSKVEQFQDNQSKGLEYTQQWEFINKTIGLEALTHGAAHPESDPVNTQVNVGGIPFIVNSFYNRICRDNSLNFIAFEEKTKEPYAVFETPGRHEILDSRRCGKVPQVINNFRGNEITGANSLVLRYLNDLPADDYVLMFTIGEVLFENFSDELKTQLETIGATRALLDGLQNGQPYILFGQKGNLTAVEFSANSDQPTQTGEPIDLDIVFSSGSFTSPRIGPAVAWRKALLGLSQLENTQDQFQLDVIGIDENNQESLLFSQSNTAEVDLSGIDAGQYPYVKLKTVLSDTANATAAQLDHWQVEFEKSPEAVLTIPESEFEKLSAYKKQEGERAQVNFELLNISDKSFTDSLEVQGILQNRDSRQSDTTQLKIQAPKPEQKTTFGFDFETLGKAGKNALFVTANAARQREVNLQNDLLQWASFLTVEADRTHPVLDVTVDGQYIMDGDIVSPEPLIRIMVKDENEILFKQDTAGLEILFQKLDCENCPLQRIALSDPAVEWFPADSTQDFTVEYKPEKLEDGRYSLIVQAEDASGNKSGVEPYRITFEVINESKISRFYPYPNPFSSSTRFVFTLTGSVVPDEIKIQIMTVSGKVVREITQDELGPIQIGHNQTEYAWDGRDEFGDLLANGVYLYRVILRSQGEAIELLENNADQKAFKQEFGKLYILR